MPLPGGTVTFLFTDIEGSTRLWETAPEAMRSALERHDALLRTAIEQNDGHIFKTMGDAFCAAFATAVDALNAALLAQQRLQKESWPDPVTLRVRMALHTGGASLRDNDYFGQPLNRVARLLSTGHGGQVLLSLPTEDLVRDSLPESARLQTLGEHRLRDLDRPETIFQLLHPDLLAEFPPLKSLENPALPNNLPQELTSFIGREKEILEVNTLLARTRLLTLTGSGGAGKTRLSLQVAAEVLENYADGVWLVELAPLTDPALLPQTVAAVLRLTEQAGKSFTQRVMEHLQDKKLLLILDNCEHLLPACTSLTDALLRHCPHVRILASSREGLGIAGEQTYRLPSLSLPDLKQTATVESISQYEAVRLFVERATLCKTDFAVTNANAPALASACHRLDGIPLAIELAAARVRSLTIEEINSKLDNRFRLLTGGSKTALPRQQTLAAAIGWSYDLLNAQERTLLARLSVFLGGWTLAAAEAVGAGESTGGENIEDWEILDLLSSLVDKSLVITEVREALTRYRLLETVRQYAADRLSQTEEGPSVRERHRDYYLRRLEEIRPNLGGAEQGHWLKAMEAEHDNLRQALHFCLTEADPSAGEQPGLRLGAALQLFWRTRGHLSEGREHLRVLLSHPAGEAPTQARADALNGAAILASDQGDYGLTRSLSLESLTISRGLEDKSGMARSLNNLGNVSYFQRDYPSAYALWQEGLSLSRELGNRSAAAVSLGNLGNLALAQSDYTQARALYEESLTISRELGNKGGMTVVLVNLGFIASHQSDFVLARSLYEESLAISRELGDKRSIAYSLGNLGNIAREQQEDVLAYALYEESLTILRELGDRGGAAYSLSNLGNLAAARGDHAAAFSLLAESLTIRRELEDTGGVVVSLEAFASLAGISGQGQRSLRLWGAAEALRELFELSQQPREQKHYEQEITEVRNGLEETVFAEAWADGHALTLEQAVAYALQARPS